MTLFKDIDNIDNDMDNDDILPFDEDDIDDDEEEDEDDNDQNEGDDEDVEELEKIEAKLEQGEDVAMSSLDSSRLPKSKVVYSCPRCKKIYLDKKWVKDNITDIYSVRTELAYCPKCEGKTYENFVGSVEIYDKNLNERKNDMKQLAKRIERELEDAESFEKILDITEKSGILFIFVNTTRLALEIGRNFRQEFHGGIQYEWFERNQFLRVKWYHEMDNRSAFKERIRALKDKRYGMFSFEDED